MKFNETDTKAERSVDWVDILPVTQREPSKITIKAPSQYAYEGVVACIDALQESLTLEAIMDQSDPSVASLTTENPKGVLEGLYFNGILSSSLYERCVQHITSSPLIQQNTGPHIPYSPRFSFQEPKEAPPALTSDTSLSPSNPITQITS